MTVAEEVRKVITEVGQLAPDFGAEADLYNDLGLDSFRMVEIFLAIEKQFKVTIAEDDYVQLRSLKQFITYLER
jgi:acyl carrier protein